MFSYSQVSRRWILTPLAFTPQTMQILSSEFLLLDSHSFCKVLVHQQVSWQSLKNTNHHYRIATGSHDPESWKDRSCSFPQLFWAAQQWHYLQDFLFQHKPGAMGRFLFALCRTSEKHSTPTESNEAQIFLNESEYFTRNAAFLLKCADLRGFTQVHPSCFMLGKVRTLTPSKSSLPQGSKL